ncbi:PREDICTED: tripartite motif-containing protein 60-like [Miniopterus natalensis]|uniref:tripartite motif-containing protein 60-like n=1 Tax=Miniopterus natalensis TaxID=291302 RepID=UPI0007A6F206|nr:PREDICTED: tripartite motif-containing protein 60-like [Miniopterus natalensis]
MDSAASLAELQAEASCPICLGYLRDPVTIECGHNFCGSCIHQRWEDLQDFFPCPVCLHPCLDRNFRRNTQLCHVTDIVKQIPTLESQRKLQEEKALCEKHHEVLTLFCEKDLELLCTQCRVSSDHRDHPLMPIEEAAAHHRRKLKSYILPLMVDVEDAEMVCEKQLAKTLKVKRKIENWRRELHCECKNLKCTLQREQDEVNASLVIEEKDIEEKLTENGRQISNHMFTLNNLLSEIAEKYLQTDLDLLTGIESIHNRYENLESPAVFTYELKKIFALPPHYLGLHTMISTFQVDLTLNPETAHPSLITSRDRKSVTYRTSNGLHNPLEFTSYPAVLSSEGFDAGRHFWQVEVRGTGECFLGVCKESFPRNTLTSPSPSNGCWQYQLWTNTCCPWPREQLQIGIFLDYELGEVSFYNMNNRLYLYRFTDTFTEKLMPYFSSAPASESLTISIIRDK